MDDFFKTEKIPKATQTRPLLGLTVLAVEDSLFACEALRLLCLRSGARIRRADCLHSARRHLKVYRPSVLIVDVGLPDGSGLDLIAEAANNTPRIGIILGTSGDDTQEALVLAAGADGFFNKPVVSLAEFQETVMSYLPEARKLKGPRRLPEEVVQPDPMAFQDDMLHLATVLQDRANTETLVYAAKFAAGVALTAHDDALYQAACAVTVNDNAPPTAVGDLADMVESRIDRRMAI